MRLLITGTGSGLGRHLHERFGGTAFHHTDDLASVSAAAPFDAVVHCGFNAGRDVGVDRVIDYFSDNALLTERLARIPARKFVFLSTVDLYPLDGGPYSEMAPLMADAMRGIYPVAKFYSEAIVRRLENYLILRPTTLLGRYARPNTLIRMLTEEHCSFGLSADSLYNCVRHEDIGEFVRIALRDDVTGVYNIGSQGRFRLEDMARRLGRKVSFGARQYSSPNLDCSRAAAHLAAFRRTSEESFEIFAREYLAPTGRPAF